MVNQHAAFACYAAAIQPAIGGHWPGARTQRALAVALGTVAVCAALASGLLILGLVFGGSIEVMRR